MAFLFRSHRSAQKVVKNLKESLVALDKKQSKEKDLRKVRVYVIVNIANRRTLAGSRCCRCRHCVDEAHSLR